MKRYLVLAACTLMPLCLGTGQGWSAFINPLNSEYHFTAFQTQLVFTTFTFFFCFMLIPAEWLHRRIGPRALGMASAACAGAGWLLASFFGSHYGFLWLSMGVLNGTAASLGYVCPIATAQKWFPHRKGLISGFAVAGYASGPIVLSFIAELLLAHGWHVLSIFRLVGFVYAPLIFAMSLLLAAPPGSESRKAEVEAFRVGRLFSDRRFWTLFIGMFSITLPFLIVMGNMKPLGVAFGVGTAAALAIGITAASNAGGRIVWGYILDRMRSRPPMIANQVLMAAAVLTLIFFGGSSPVVFLVAVCGIGFCNGSNFAIYPAVVSRIYGTHLLGSVYPWILFAHGLSSVAPSLNGMLFDATGSYYPGLIVAAGVIVAGMVATIFLSRTIDEERVVEPPADTLEEPLV